MKISIVTISFNQIAFLQAAMDSVLSQGYPDLEYIVVDPGSTDGSRELIESYSDRISHIVFERDKGAADGLNKGFALATGEIFGYLNSDDLLLPGSLRAVADFFEQHPSCDIGMGDGYILDVSGQKTKHVEARDVTLKRYFHGGCRWLQQATFFRRETFLRSPGFNLENRTSWDGELLAQMLNRGAVVGYVHADLAGFRIYSTSLTGSGATKDAYGRDHDRFFREISGRNWRVTDKLLHIVYRIEGLLIRTGLWPHGNGMREPS
jgi:glycosyltransferase involved in cell wall biosynthesis